MSMLHPSRTRRWVSTPILLTCLALAGRPAAAEDARTFSPQKTYDLGDLISLGLSSNPSTRAAWFQARAASAAVGQARAPYFPQISARFEGGSDQWYTPAGNAPDNFRREQATTILSLEYLLLDFGRRSADLQEMIARFDAAGLAYERELQRVVFAVQRAYFLHEAALRRQGAAEALRLSALTTAETVRKEAQSGLAARPEVLAAQRNLLEADYELEDALAGVRISLGELCRTAGLPANAPLRVAPAGQPLATADLRQKADTLIASALAARPDLAARAADVRAREQALRRARADFLPEVSIEGSYAYSAFQYEAHDGRTHGRYAEDINGYGAFLVAKWDLFDGFERVERVRKKRAEEAASREDLSQARLDATRDVWTAYQENLSAASRVASAESFVASARENDEAARLAYKEGLAPVAELSAASSQLALAESRRATAIADYSTSLAALAFAVGSAPVQGAAP